jgi:hypothetical protein
VVVVVVALVVSEDRVVRKEGFDVDVVRAVVEEGEFVVELVFPLAGIGNSSNPGRSSRPYRYSRTGDVEGDRDFVWMWEQDIRWVRWDMQGNSMERRGRMAQGLVVSGVVVWGGKM